MAAQGKWTPQSAASVDDSHPASRSGHLAAVSESQCSLRAALVADLPALLAIEAQFPGDRLSLRQFRHHLRSPRAHLRVLQAEDGGLLGYALLLLHARRRAARLYSIAVDAQWRGHGYGARLLVDAEQEAVAAGCRALQLEVRADNSAALALYRARGYQVFARRAGYYEDGQAAVCLRREIPLPIVPRHAGG